MAIRDDWMEGLQLSQAEIIQIRMVSHQLVHDSRLGRSRRDEVDALSVGNNLKREYLQRLTHSGSGLTVGQMPIRGKRPVIEPIATIKREPLSTIVRAWFCALKKHNRS